MAADDLESLHETLYRLSGPGIRASLAEAEREHEAGRNVSGEELRTRYPRVVSGLDPQRASFRSTVRSAPAPNEAMRRVCRTAAISATAYGN